MKRSELKRNGTRPKRRPISPASPAQRAKVKDTVCRYCGRPGVQPAHVVDRSLGGCDDADCVISLCAAHHEAYDAHRLDVLPLLKFEEQAHAVGHVGLISALERVTGLSWAPAKVAA